MNHTVLQVRMLGKFSLTYGDKQISCDNNRSRQIWNILAYLIYNRGKVVSSDDLMALMWNSEKSDNPPGALRTAMHRVRSLLESLMPEFGRKLLLYKSGGYMWDPEIEVFLDIEEFEKQIALLKSEEAADDIEAYIAALNLYEGDFLTMQSSDAWVVPVQAYYHNLYESAIEKAMPALQKTGRHTEAVIICRKALAIDQYSEPMYQHLMRFLLAMDKRQDVVTVYEDMSKLLLATFGVMPDQESRALYREALQTVNSRVISPEWMMEQLNESGEIKGALICDYDFFRMLYQAQARMIVRTGDAIHIALLSLKSRSTKEVSQKSIALAMDNLEAHMSQSLRKGDVITRCSASQFIIMLPQANYENSCMVCRRFISSFERKYPHSPIYVEFYVKSLLPATNS
ncbi:MAG: hypothetical protein E7631_08575 [Ruminococcaceae bacterium]|nr:hypothetical protein [Oscillospiraceae bacterium]